MAIPRNKTLRDMHDFHLEPPAEVVHHPECPLNFDEYAACLCVQIRQVEAAFRA